MPARPLPFVGELIGTFVLVLVGCGSCAWSVLDPGVQLWHVAALWGLAVTLAIFASRRWSDAHLNPLVTFGLLMLERKPIKTVLTYLSGQIVGALLGAIALWLLVGGMLAEWELANAALGEDVKATTARAFADFHPTASDWTTALWHESLGSMILFFMICLITAKWDIQTLIAPILIGLVVALLIYFLAETFMLGMNPARDLIPRLFAAVAGWGEHAFSKPGHTAFTVYTLTPIVSGILAGGVVAAIRKSSNFART